jgi:hypothetical protein
MSFGDLRHMMEPLSDGFGVQAGYGERPSLTPTPRFQPKEAYTPTAEYAVGTLGACTIGGVLVKIGQSEWFGDLVKGLLDKIPGILPF